MQVLITLVVSELTPSVDKSWASLCSPAHKEFKKFSTYTSKFLSYRHLFMLLWWKNVPRSFSMNLPSSWKTKPNCTLVDARIHGEYNEFYCFFKCVGVPCWVIMDSTARQSGDATVCCHPVIHCIFLFIRVEQWNEKNLQLRT